ncbi:SGNH/GDSL hydrolase family protein [Allostreptomyces psammosilenae]|uniref:Lysophospholipase L1-like esterase n=1 Tax=Allostreptomyces psammosilenae TaxID=1892865 RepID=A0A853A346_9ACTN|nr:SGNH/GDSL hydrolase family protein [Allostreptomyces psammosilenae]NYI04898.1 lysophospholipase L1-like esterase [Allostreptomyces psammosilenae]
MRPDLTRPNASYLALGDSFTEGLHDEVGPLGRHRGWADRVADALAAHHGGLRYANLAVRGRLLDQVVAEQLPVALRRAPELVSFHAGGNDVLRPRVDVDAVVARYEAAVGRLRARGGAVLLFTVIERAGGSGRTAERLAARFARFNASVRAVAERHGCLLVDAAAHPVFTDRRLWHEDRLHLGPAGHARMAAAVLEALEVTEPALLGGEPGWWRLPLAAAGPRDRGADLAADLLWVRRHLLPWVGRRLRGVSSGDALLPKQPEPIHLAPPVLPPPARPTSTATTD